MEVDQRKIKKRKLGSNEKKISVRDQKPKSGDLLKTKKSKENVVTTKSLEPPISEIADGPEEYDFDSSDDEDIRNTIGNVPLSWYTKYEHVGYDTTGSRIAKPESLSKMEEFTERMENPDYWRTVIDTQTGGKIVLSDELVHAVRQYSGHKSISDSYEKWDEWFSDEKMETPLTAHPPQKRSFIPSKWERLAVGRLVHAIKMGRITPGSRKPVKLGRDAKMYDLWSEGPRAIRRPGPPELAPPKRPRMYAPPPKQAPPSHYESYNPAPEYLFDEEETEKWNSQEDFERKINFLPRQYNSMRLIPAYHSIYREYFSRYMDMCSAPRVTRQRVRTTPDQLLPKLPNLSELMPFPTMEGLVFRGHVGLVLAIAVSPCGHWLASAGVDGTLRLWDVVTAFCMRTVKLPGPVEPQALAWNPSSGVCLLAVACGNSLIILNPELAHDECLVTSTTESLTRWSKEAAARPAEEKSVAKWEFNSRGQIVISHSHRVKAVSWHNQGDYLASLCDSPDKQAILLHRVSQFKSQQPFSRPKGVIERVMFHPRKPHFIVVSKRQAKFYDLSRQKLIKTLRSNCREISSVDIHKSGDHFITGSFEGRFEWFDLDLSKTAFMNQKYKSCIRKVDFHTQAPLFAVSMDNGSVIIGHCTIYNELDKNPDIFPVQILKGHSVTDNLGVLDCKFHPTHPYLFTAGADGNVKMFV